MDDNARTARIHARRRQAVKLFLVLCVFAHFAGLFGLYAVPMYWSHRTYISENALQAGIHSTYWADSALAYSHKERLFGEDVDADELIGYLKGLETHRWENSTFAFVRSSRADTSGCVAVSAHYESVDSVAFSAKLAQFLHANTKFVGRDVLFLWTHNATTAPLQRWLDMYYSGNGLFRRCGPIQQALHLDFGANIARGSKVTLAMEGAQLPNLDLINAFVQIAEKFGVPRKNILTARRFSHPVLKQLPSSVAFFLQFLINQFVGSSGSHSVFNGMAADCITISLLPASAKSATLIRVEALAHTVESTLRSLLTLQEPLHQSFYFYVLPSAVHYVSIGDYMIIFGLLLAVVPLTVAVVVLDPLFDSSIHWERTVPVVAAALGLGVAAASLTPSLWVWASLDAVSFFGMVALFAFWLRWQRGAAQGKSPLSYGSFVVCFGVISGALVVCSLVNFAVAIVGSTLVCLHLLAWWVVSQRPLVAVVLHAGLDPLALLLYASQVAGVPFEALLHDDSMAWRPWICLVYIPFRCLLTDALFERICIFRSLRKEKQE